MNTNILRTRERPFAYCVQSNPSPTPNNACLTGSYHHNNINYYVISSDVEEIVEGPAVLGVGQAVEFDPIYAASGCNTQHCAQNFKPDL